MERKAQLTQRTAQVLLHMPVELVFLEEALAAAIAVVQPDACMHPAQVSVQMALLHESLITIGARKSPVVRLMVQAVVLQLAPRQKGLAAKVTDVAKADVAVGVHPLGVSVQVGPLPEGRRAERTDEGLLARVRSQVALEELGLQKSPAA